MSHTHCTDPGIALLWIEIFGVRRMVDPTQTLRSIVGNLRTVICPVLSGAFTIAPAASFSFAFNPEDMLERLRDQRIVFVGDSLGRNQWESMLCMLAEGVQNKSRIYEVHGQSISKVVGELIFRFEDYNCTVEYYRDTFLVPQTRPPPDLPENVTSVLKIDHVSWSAGSWPGANVMIFNTGHWWSWEKIGRPGGRFYMEQKLTTHSNEDAFKIGMKTWASWMERNLHPTTTQVFFRSFAPVHFRGGSWNKAGHCHEEVKPFTDEEVQQLQQVPWTNKLIVEAIDQNIKTKRSAVEYVDITTSTNYRSDGHPGLYGNDVKVNGFPPKNRQDCSHFCLPGVPDTWNELLYAALLARGQGVWGKFV
ncbi:protein trichome birefringence-like 11 isoform X2 [Physcomitrium patens]|uniref:protein trichome birefringence-like 11 isoform X2 n=1 Tax=Physcomitrium patens TaxID=3218 RepID=UPI000D16D7E5|nr:protein trichome birefringence-like 11 isoform X2 [Physcomitrium patens]|eukprot:XP_024364916.1 protein trichome birefringence-like 11 isoform X2 [Physcomitrella patens]